MVGEEPGGEGNVGADNEDPPMRDDAAVDLEGVKSAGPVPDGGESSHVVKTEQSAAVQDNGTGNMKVGDEAPAEAVADEKATPEQGAGSYAANEPKGGVAGDQPEAGQGPGGRMSSNLAQRVKQQGRMRKVAAVQLSPYRSPTRRRYSRRCGRGGVSTAGRHGRVPNVAAEPSTAGTDDVVDVRPIAAVTAEVRESCTNM